MTSAASASSPIAAALDEIAAIAADLGDRAVAQALEAVRAHKQTSRLQLRVVGLTGSGRATLVNLLLGTDVVPVSAIPKAHVGFDIRHGDAVSVTRVDPNGDRVAVAPSQLRSVLFDGDAGQGRIEIEAPSSLLALCDLHIESLEAERRAESWRDLLAATDYVVLLLNASALLSDGERRFVRDHLVPIFGLERVAFIVNHMDLVPEEERDSILELVQTFLGPFQGRPAMVDLALRNTALRGEGRRTIETLLDDVLERREPVRAQGLRYTAAALAEELSETAARLEALYGLEASEVEGARESITGQQQWLEQRVERTQRRIRAWVETLLRETLQRRIENFGAAVRNRLPEEIRSIDDSALARRHVPGYIEAVWLDFLRRQMIAMRGDLEAEEAQVAAMIDADFRELLAAVGQPALSAEWDLGTDPAGVHVFVMPRRARRRAENIARGLAFNGFFMLIFFSPPLGILSLLASQVVQRVWRADLAKAEAQALTTSALAATRQVEQEIKRRMDEQFRALTDQLEQEVADVYRRGMEGLLTLLGEREAHAGDLAARRQQISDIVRERLPHLREQIGSAAGEQES